MSKVVGGTLPILAKKAGVDPAIMAAPLITTVVDALGLILYFSIAVRLCRYRTLFSFAADHDFVNEQENSRKPVSHFTKIVYNGVVKITMEVDKLWLM